MEPSSSKLMLLAFFSPTVRRALFLVHACPVLTSWLGKDRIMDSLKRFFFKQENFKIQKRLGEDRVIDFLLFFSSKKFEN